MFLGICEKCGQRKDFAGRFCDRCRVARLPRASSDLTSLATLISVGGILAVAGLGALKEQIPLGSHCRVSRAIYGTRDLDKAHDELEKAQQVKDEYGLAELANHDMAFLISEGTHGLVIDSDFFTHLSFYRKVRILDGPYVGKALWARMDALEVDDPGRRAPDAQPSDAQPPAPQPSTPETCRDPHERLGSAGVCFCEPGYKRDATTLKCTFDAAAAQKKYNY